MITVAFATKSPKRNHVAPALGEKLLTTPALTIVLGARISGSAEMVKHLKSISIVLLLAVVVQNAASQNSDHAYEYKYGPGQYNYDVSGYDEGGDYVHGNVDTDDGDVEGYIVNEEGEEVYFYGEFVDRGEIEGYDEDGNFVSLEVD